MNHNTSSQMSDQLFLGNRASVSSKLQSNNQKRIIENFKAKQIGSRIRQQKQVRRIQQYSDSRLDMINSSEKAAEAEDSKDDDQMRAPPPRGTPMDVNKANEDIRRSA